MTLRRHILDDDRFRLDRSYQKLPAESLFVGQWKDLGPDCWKPDLRKEAEQYGVPAEMFFEPKQAHVGTVVIEDPPTECAGAYERRHPETKEIKLNDKPLPKGVRPAECEDPEARCFERLVGFTSPKINQTSLNYAEASKWALEETRTMYPAAELCDSGPWCVQFKVTHDRDSDGKLWYYASASAEVPVFFGKLFSVRAGKRRMSEMNVIRRAPPKDFNFKEYR